MLFLSMISLAAGIDPPVIRYSRNGDDHVVEVAEFDPAAGPSVEAAIARRAGELCAGLQIRWGQFAFDENLAKVPGAAPSGVKSYRREFRCVPPDPRVFAAAPSDWTATAGDERDVRGVFATYYVRRDRGDFASARAMLSEQTRSSSAEY